MFFLSASAWANTHVRELTPARSRVGNGSSNEELQKKGTGARIASLAHGFLRSRLASSAKAQARLCCDVPDLRKSLSGNCRRAGENVLS